jgi:hypothetical protein
MTDQDVSLAGWSLATSPDDRQSISGAIAASQSLAVNMPKASFEPNGGVVTLLDQVGLKVASAIYTPASNARPGWSKVS